MNLSNYKNKKIIFKMATNLIMEKKNFKLKYFVNQ